MRDKSIATFNNICMWGGYCANLFIHFTRNECLMVNDSVDANNYDCNVWMFLGKPLKRYDYANSFVVALL